MTAKPYDLVIRRGSIIDGTGSPWSRSDVAVSDGKIVGVGHYQPDEALDSIDANGLLLTPGFIDAHTHGDFSLIANPAAQSQLLQGITSEVDGQCGYSAFPLLESSRGFIFEPKDMPIDWSSPSEYFNRLTLAKPALNTVFFVGHTIVRAAVAGRVDRKLTDNELDRMHAYVREAMEAGAIGLSTGLDYPPGGSADTEELVALCRTVAKYGGLYASHLRGYTRNFLNAVAEAIEIGQRSGVRVQMSHFGATGPGNAELTAQALELVDEARQDGVDVMIDVIPYGTGGAWWAPRAIFPEWAYDWRENNLEKVRELLQDSETRSRLRKDVEARRTMTKQGFQQERLIFSDWKSVTLAEVAPSSRHTHLVGSNFSEIAETLGQEPVDAYFDLLVQEYPYFSTVCIARSAEAMKMMLQRPYTMIGSDSVATSPEKAKESFNVLQAHPRNYGCFPYFLANMVRDQKLLSWEDAIRRITSLPAQRFGLKGRGLIREGMWADLVVFDRDRIAAGSTWRQPRLLPQGILHVLVNGQLAIRDGKITESRAGQVTRARQ